MGHPHAGVLTYNKCHIFLNRPVFERVGLATSQFECCGYDDKAGSTGSGFEDAETAEAEAGVT